MNNKVATIFGGTGFIGRQVVRALAQKGWTVKVATRVPESAYFLKLCGAVGQVVPFPCDYEEPKSIAAAVHKADYVVNCIGILHERRKGDFGRVHIDIPKMIAQACKKEKVARFVHLSSLGVTGDSAYGKSKAEGDKAVMKACPDVTILRPSVVFGADDRFFNLFAGLARICPVLPLIGGGKTRFQPVYVGDVAAAVMAGLCLSPLDLSSLGKQDPRGAIYELGGPEIVSLREIYERVFAFTGRRRKMLSLPWRLAMVQAWFMACLPNPVLTPDQVVALKTDMVVGEGAKGLSDLGVEPTAIDLIVPDYLSRFRPGGIFGAIQRV